MVLKIVANGVVLNLALDASSFENLRVSYTGKLEDLWRLNGTARYHDFPLHIDTVRCGLMDKIDTNSVVTFQLH